MSATTLRIERRDGAVIVVEAGPIAEWFFAQPFAAAWQTASRSTSRNSVLWRDVDLINRCMGARSPDRVWEPLAGKRPRWLENIDPGLDLIRTSPRRWKSLSGDDLVRKALVGCVGPGRNIARSTKLLHLKWPRLFPILDRVVVQVLSERFSIGFEERAKDAAALIVHLRAQGRANLAALCDTQARVQDATRQRVPLIRILEAVLFMSNPSLGGGWVGDRRRVFSCRLD